MPPIPINSSQMDIMKYLLRHRLDISLLPHYIHGCHNYDMLAVVVVVVLV